MFSVKNTRQWPGFHKYSDEPLQWQVLEAVTRVRDLSE